MQIVGGGINNSLQQAAATLTVTKAAVGGELAPEVRQDKDGAVVGDFSGRISLKVVPVVIGLNFAW